MKKTKISSNFDWALAVLPLILAISGIATLYSITSISGNHGLFYDQIVFFVLGLIFYLVFSFFDYKNIRPYVWYIYLINLILLIAVEFFGTEIFGSKRWIDLVVFQIQPSELMKFSLIILFARIFSSFEKPNLYRYIAMFVLVAAPLLLILREPDLGTTIAISASFVGLLVISPISRKIKIGLAIAAIAISPLLWSGLRPYQRERITTFVNPYSDPLGSGYNVSQARIAVGSGGLFGKGFGGATQSQLKFLPVSHVDFIFSGWAEATGFVGSLTMVGVYALLIWKIFAVSVSSRDKFGYFISSGVGFLIFFQSFVNIGMNIGIMPVTGIPLPLVSYGGTSFIVTSILLGVVQSVSLRRKAIKFD